jgi:hypothetical protein
MSSGDTLGAFMPSHNVAPVTAYAQFDTRNGRLVLDFDAATIESAMFPGVLSRNYAAGGITVTLVGAFTSDVTITNAARLGVSFERLENNGTDIDADSFATEKTVDVSPRATSGSLVYGTVAFSNAEIDGLLLGELYRLRVRRVANDAADTATGDFELMAVELRET